MKMTGRSVAMAAGIGAAAALAARAAWGAAVPDWLAWGALMLAAAAAVPHAAQALARAMQRFADATLPDEEREIREAHRRGEMD